MQVERAAQRGQPLGCEKRKRKDAAAAWCEAFMDHCGWFAFLIVKRW